MTSPPRVLIAYSYSMHYRLGVFRALLEASEADVTIAVGETVAAHAAQLVQPIDPAELPEMQVHRTQAWRSLRWQPTLLRESLSPRYDVVIWDPSLHCLTMWASSVLLRARGRTLLYWGLGWTRSHGRVKEQAKVWGFRLAHAFLTYGHRSRQRAVAAGYPADRLYVVGNSIVDTPQAAVVAREEMLPAQPLVLGTSVRLSARKRVDLLIEAAAVLQRSGTAVRVRIVGDGPERAGLEHLAARRGVEVDFLGPLYEPDAIADFYRSIHLTVLPGHAGLTVLQSLMHGRPVVTHDDPDHHAAEWEALEDGVTGAFFPPGDVAELVAAIQTVAGWVRTRNASLREACRAAYLAVGSPAAHAHRVLDAASHTTNHRKNRQAAEQE
ncbi:MAG: glycosyltransferase family 4 protein [Actinobacteria bacterium]|nr:glycosyltransferase family 4 protein [Actinomycetota bacterium]